MRAGWQRKQVREVADVFDGPHATPKTVGSGPIFLGISALKDGAINLDETRHVTEEDFRKWTRRVEPQTDDVVFSYETRLGEAAIIPDGLQCCLGRRMGLIRFKDGMVVPRFFLYQFLSPAFRAFLDSKTIRGATVDRISIKEFPSFHIYVAPLAEQQRIVAISDEVFAGLATATANAEKNLTNARELFEAMLVREAFKESDEDAWEQTTIEFSLASEGFNPNGAFRQPTPAWRVCLTKKSPYWASITLSPTNFDGEKEDLSHLKNSPGYHGIRCYRATF